MGTDNNASAIPAIPTDYSQGRFHKGVITQAISQPGLDNLFTHHPPKGDQPERYVALRNKAKELAEMIVKYCPPSADTTTAIRKLRECVMVANAAIACNE